MSQPRKISKEVFVEQTRNVLLKVQTQSEIALRLASYGYTEDKINEGLRIHQDACALIEVSNDNQKNKQPLYLEYIKLRSELEQLYARHRNKALKIFRKSPDVLGDLFLAGTIPTTYSDWTFVVERFYCELHANKILQERLVRFQFSLTEIKRGKQLFDQMQKARASYLKQANGQGDKDFENHEEIITLEQWMDDFLIAAELALEDKPRLLKSLGITEISI